jgi:hypothetical protein
MAERTIPFAIPGVRSPKQLDADGGHPVHRAGSARVVGVALQPSRETAGVRGRRELIERTLRDK